jgi:hypothetical protein
LPRDASSALSQLWRQAHFDERQISREVLRVVARLVSWSAFDAGLSIEELILGVTTSWLAAEVSHRPSEMHLQWAFAKLVALSVEEFHYAVRDSEARIDALERLRVRGARA